MAEFVEFRAEEWISELEQMERIHLFEPKEVKSIATKRREFEYKIQRKTKCKEDFLKFIQFEVDLQRIIKARREKNNINSKKAEIEYSQASRIVNLFKQVIYRFQDDIKLWLSLFKFCEEVKFKGIVSQMLVRMLQIHSNKPDLWVFAAMWEINHCDSVENARQFLMRGLRHHPSSELLYTELFKLELEHMKKKSKEKEKKMQDDEWVSDEVAENIIEGKVAEVVYMSAIKILDGVDFKISLLNVAKNYKGTENLQKKIFEDIMKNHSDDELAWDAMAKREYEGFACNFLDSEDGQQPMEVDKNQDLGKTKTKERLQRSIQVYERAVKKLNTPRMWGLYLDHVLEINGDVTSVPIMKFKLLRNAMEEAMVSGNMEEKYFLHYAEVLRKIGKKSKRLSEVLRKGTEQHSDSLELWHARLRFHLSRNEADLSSEIFRKAIEKIPNALPIWKLMIQYLQIKQPIKVEEVFHDGIKRGGEIAQSLKPLYIEWIALTKGIDEARSLFETTEYQHPPCLELYTKMTSLESTQAEHSLKHLRRCHELACSNFGQTNSNVWLDYIKFEMKHGDVTKVDQIHRRAMKALQVEQADEFLTEFNCIKIGTTT